MNLSFVMFTTRFFQYILSYGLIGVFIIFLNLTAWPEPKEDAAIRRIEAAVTPNIGKGEIRQWKGAQGGPSEFSVVVARSKAEWRTLWGIIGQEPPASFDPSSEVAIAIFLGQRPTAGYDVENISLQQEG